MKYGDIYGNWKKLKITKDRIIGKKYVICDGSVCEPGMIVRLKRSNNGLVLFTDNHLSHYGIKYKVANFPSLWEKIKDLILNIKHD